eukprot:3475547-Pleurochrysis_carterae.AAC.5
MATSSRSGCALILCWGHVAAMPESTRQTLALQRVAADCGLDVSGDALAAPFMLSVLLETQFSRA